VFVIIVFVAGLGIGYFVRSAGIGTAQQWETHEADLAAVEKLHKKNMEVTLSQDPQGLLDLWAEDGVLLEPGSLPVVGKQAIQIYNKNGRGREPRFQSAELLTNVQGDSNRGRLGVRVRRN
jgi:hypothetical protein